jgi:hypothetical protein
MPLHPTEPGLADVLAALTAREPLFHRPGHGTTRAQAEAVTAPDFVEMLGVVEERERRGEVEVLDARDPACRELAPGLYQLTYRLRQGERETWRSSLWRRDPDGWRVVFHQGTVVLG